MPLQINLTSASSEALDSPMSSAITNLAAKIKLHSIHGLVPSAPNLDITFMIPGKLDKPNFTGMSMGGFESTENTLFFQKPVPEDLINSPKANDFVRLVLEDVVDNAAEFFGEHDYAFHRSEWSQFVNSLSRVN
ncbi:hypothetical protein NBRC116494_22420 [Aurantivibrio plasticivorans]